MSIEQFIENLRALINSKSPVEGQSPLVLPPEIVDILLTQPNLEAAIHQATVALTGSNSPLSAGDIRAAANQALEPQIGDPRYTHQTDELPGFLGVPRNYDVDGISIYTTDENGEFLFYKNGSQYSLIANQTPEVKAALQAELVNAGLLKMGTFIPGRWNLDEDSPETLAFEQVLMRANKTGDPDFTNSLRWFVDNQETIESFQIEPSYLPPDYATLSQSVKSLFRNDPEIDREPQPYELKLLADQLLSDYESTAPKPVPDIGDVTGEQLLSGDYGNHITIPDDKEVSEIEPTARLLETFDRITKKERERLGRNADIQTSNNLMLNSIISAPR
tara:strand:- start:139 stop:1137 length:999 start_codon:yes stop_codon:yes gene_type:complete